GRAQQELVEAHARRQEAAVRADLPEWNHRSHRPAGHGIGDQLENQEARVAAVEEAEPIAPRLDLEDRPGAAVDHQRVPEELRVEYRRDVTGWDVGATKVGEEFARGRVERR